MKYLLVLIFLVFSVQYVNITLAQPDNPIVLSPERIIEADEFLKYLYRRLPLLTDGWRYHPGDDLAWAHPAYDDSDWELVHSMLHPGKLPESGWHGIGWFRLHFRVDQAFWNQPLILAYGQIGASEIYLNGRRIYAFGKVGASKETEQTDFTLDSSLKIEPITFSPQPEQLIAIRYSNFETYSFYRQRFDTPMMGFAPVILSGDLNLARKTHENWGRNGIRYQFFVVSALLAFTVLHLLLFLFYPRFRENLYFAGFTGSYAVLTFFAFQQGVATSAASFLVFASIFKLSVIPMILFECRFLYSLFSPKIPRQFWVLVVIGAVLGVFSWALPVSVIYLYVMVALVEPLRVILTAVVQKKDGAWIIGLGGLAFIISGAYQMLIEFGLPPIVDFPYIYGILASLISMSLYLARRFAKTNKDLEKRSNELYQLNVDLENRVKKRTEFIRETFGRYVSDEVVENLLESPEGLQVGGEKREATILMSDLRGFSSITEGLPPEKSVSLLNAYLSAMTEVIIKHGGTIDEFIGDAILVIFGAPIWKSDHAERAVACAVEMQLAIEQVNRRNRENGLPEVEMGVGVNTGEVVVGNIGSQKRAKYGVVGSSVNLTARIESYTVGGQILISEQTFKATAGVVKIIDQIEVEPKGVRTPITVYEVGGVKGSHNLFLPERLETLHPLVEPIPIRYTILEEKFAGRTVFDGRIVKLSPKAAEIFSKSVALPLSNLRMQIVDTDADRIVRDFYGKVVDKPTDSDATFHLHFTSVTPEVAAFLQTYTLQESS